MTPSVIGVLNSHTLPDVLSEERAIYSSSPRAPHPNAEMNLPTLTPMELPQAPCTY